MLARTGETRTENHIRLSAQDRLQQAVILRRIIFQVRVLNNDYRRFGMGDPRGQGRALSLVLLVS